MSRRSGSYPKELRDRAVRMVAEVRSEHASEWAAIESVASKLGIGSAQTVHNWVRKAEVDAGTRPGTRGSAGGPRRGGHPIFGLVLQGPLRSAVGRGKYGARLTVCGGCGHRLAGLFVLIRGYWQGVFRSTPIRLWCYEPVD